jgi:hypothetical protein
MARTAKQIAEDGAKPGSGTPEGEVSFNSETTAKEREAKVITLGEDETAFHRRRKNWQVTRELRALLRKQERSQLAIARVNKQLSELPIEAPDADVQKLEDRVDALQDEGDVAAYEIIALLLRDDEGNAPTVEMLQEGVDVEDVGTLANRLAGGGEQVADPTETATS